MLDDFDDIFNSASDYEDKTTDTTEQTDEEHSEVETEVEEDSPEDEEVAQEETEVEDEAEEEEEDDEPSLEISHGKEKQRVPLATFLDQIDKRKEEKARADDLERQLNELKSRYEKPDKEPERFDPLVDPDGYTAQMEARIEQAVFNERMVQCYTRAAATHAPDYLKTVETWAFEKADKDPAFNAQANQVPDPVAWAIQQYEADQKFQLMTSDPVAYARKIAEEQGWFTQGTTVTETVPVQKTTAKKPVRSLTGAGAKSTAKPSTQDLYADFNAIFDRK